jgi:hypothetical protein
MLIAKRSFERRVERVIVDVQGSSERVKVRIEWIGGGHTEGVVIRPIGKLSELSTYPQICHQIQMLTEAGWAAVAIAQALNEAGFRPPRSTTGFRPEMITQLQRQLGMKAPRPRVRHHEGFLPDEWWPTELARQLHIPRGTLLHWIRQGVVRARQLDEPLHRWWYGLMERSRNGFEPIISARLGTSSAIAGRNHHLLNNLDEDIIRANHERSAQWQAHRTRKQYLGVVWLGHGTNFCVDGTLSAHE